MSLYNTDGQVQIVLVSGATRTGIQSTDGPYNGVLSDGTTRGLYHACGAYNVNISTEINPTWQDANGSLNIVSNGNAYVVQGGNRTINTNIELREDGGIELREDSGTELRE